jgi:CPA1 family monovalent cation:H+ antiporter
MRIASPITKNHKLIILLSLILLTILTGCTSEDINNLIIQNPVTNGELITDVSPIDQSEIEAVEEAEQIDERLLIIEEIVIGLLFIASIVGIIAQRLRVPYTIGLVLMGLALTIFGRTDIDIVPDLILALLVPPLLYEAAFHLNAAELRRNYAPILALAIPGVLLTTLIVGFIVSQGTELTLGLALVFGAIVSATDPVSVVSLFRSMGVPKRLQLLLEGESLFNDGTAIVIFNLVVTTAILGAASFNLGRSVVQFIIVSGGGLVVGIVLGTVMSHIISRIDDYLIETTLTSVLAFGSFLIAELLGVSGVLAVVAAGLVSGSIGPKGMSPTTRIVVFNFWEYAAFIANSFVFLLIGIRIDLPILLENWQSILWAIIAILIARAVSIYGFSWIGRGIPFKWQHIMYWGGLRGAISLALALSLPAALGSDRDQIQAMAFGVVLFTLLIQGLSMSPLVKRLKLVERDESKEEYERRHARAVATQSAYEHTEKMHQQGLISKHTWQLLDSPLQEHNDAMAELVRDVMSADPSVGTEELDTAHREYLRAQRSTYSSLLKDGVISNENYEQLVSEVDTALSENDVYWPELIINQAVRRRSINRLVTAVIQEQDVVAAISALGNLGLSVTRLPSTGGFLGHRSATLIIGLSVGQEKIMTRALLQNCRARVEYVPLPLEGPTLPLPSPTPVTVGGSTIFFFEVERYEEF